MRMMSRLIFALIALLCTWGIQTAHGHDVSADIRRLLQAAEELDQNMDDLEEDMDDIEDEIEDIDDEIEDFGEGIEDMETGVQAVATEVVGLRGEVRELFSKQVQEMAHKTSTDMAELKEKVHWNANETEIVKEELVSLQRDMNSTLYLLQELRNQLVSLRQENSGGHQNIMAGSCGELHPLSQSGYYRLRGVSEKVYCDMDRQSCGCGSTRGWMRVADIDMTDPNQQCPDGFRLRPDTPKRMCEMTITSSGCTSIVFPTHSVQYNKVCGRVHGYQDGTPDAFASYHYHSRTIDEVYLEGVSVTHGQNPRKHIWSFAGAVDEIHHNEWTCPCTQTTTSYTGTVPPFVGNDYFCDTGSRNHYEFKLYSNDPLWNGQGCGPTSSCCQFNSPPWFCKELPQPTTDDIEVRVCRDEGHSNEDIPFELIELYVQ